MGSTFYTELRTSAYVVPVQRDAFSAGLAKGVTAPKLGRCASGIELPQCIGVARGLPNARKPRSLDEFLNAVPLAKVLTVQMYRLAAKC